MPEVAVDVLNKQQVESAADDCLKRFHASRSIPVPIERIIDNDFRVDVVPVDRLELDFDTIAFLSQDLKEIRVDRRVLEQARTNPGRLNFSLAHELGHVVLHRVIFQRLHFDDIADFGRALEAMSDREYGFMEWQADYFASCLLLPRTEFQRRLNEVLVPVSRAMGTTGNLLSELSEVGQEYAVKALGKELAVSAGSIWKRLRGLSML